MSTMCVHVVTCAHIYIVNLCECKMFECQMILGINCGQQIQHFTSTQPGPSPSTMSNKLDQIRENQQINNASNSNNEVTIVGAGLAGSLMALILQRRGYKVTMYERYNDVRTIPSAGRSINLVLTSRGLRAMKLLGDPRLIKDMYDLSVPVTGRVMHQDDGKKLMYTNMSQQHCT